MLRIKSSQPIKTLIVQSPERFEETTKRFKEICPFPYYHVSDGVASTSPKKTFGANTCTVLAMSNGEQTYLGHFAPEFMKGDFKQKLDYIVQQFKDKTGQLSAMITGGYSHLAPPNKAESVKSFEQLTSVSEVVGRHTDDITMIAGKSNPVFVENLAVDGENFILSHSKKLGKGTRTPQLKQNPTPQEIEQAFYENYEIAEFDATPKIIFDV